MTSALGCLVHLAGLAVVTILVDRATAAALPSELRPWVPLVAAATLTLGLSNVWSLARGYGQGESSRRALLQGAHAGQPPSQDGPVLATGRVRTDGPPLVSPVTGRPCAAYQYRIYERYLRANADWETRVFYWGYACRPFRLNTPLQAWRILAMPRFLDQPTRFEDVADERARTEAYLRATPFASGTPGMGLAGEAMALGNELFTELRRDVRRDWQRPGAPVELDGLRIEEHVLPVDETASAWGLWSAERRAILPGGLLSAAPGIAMVPGPPEGLLGSVAGPPSSAMAVGVAAVVLLALGAALVWAARAGYVAQAWVAVAAAS